jgi:hypothetical protein
MKVYLNRKGHQDYAIVMDKAGKIRGMYDATSKSESKALRKKLLELLEEDLSPEEAAASTSEATS